VDVCFQVKVGAIEKDEIHLKEGTVERKVGPIDVGKDATRFESILNLHKGIGKW